MKITTDERIQIIPRLNIPEKLILFDVVNRCSIVWINHKDALQQIFALIRYVLGPIYVQRYYVFKSCLDVIAGKRIETTNELAKHDAP